MDTYQRTEPFFFPCPPLTRTDISVPAPMATSIGLPSIGLPPVPPPDTGVRLVIVPVVALPSPRAPGAVFPCIHSSTKATVTKKKTVEQPAVNPVVNTVVRAMVRMVDLVEGERDVPPRHDRNDLPIQGWHLVVTRRQSGATRGDRDVYVYTDHGSKLRSSLELDLYRHLRRDGRCPPSFPFHADSVVDRYGDAVERYALTGHSSSFDRRVRGEIAARDHLVYTHGHGGSRARSYAPVAASERGNSRGWMRRKMAARRAEIERRAAVARRVATSDAGGQTRARKRRTGAPSQKRAMRRDDPSASKRARRDSDAEQDDATQRTADAAVLQGWHPYTPYRDTVGSSADA